MKYSTFTKYGISMTLKGRFSVILADGPLGNKKVRVHVKGNLVWLEPGKTGIYGSKYSSRKDTPSWSYQVTDVSLGSAWRELTARYPEGISMMELGEPMKLANGGLRFHLPDPSSVLPSVAHHPVPRRNLGSKGHKKGSNMEASTAVLEHHPLVAEARRTEEAKVNKLKFSPTSVKVATELVEANEVGMDFDSAVEFLNSLKASFGDNFSMKVRDNGMLYAAFLLEAGPGEDQ